MTTPSEDEGNYKYDCYINAIPSRDQVQKQYATLLYELYECKDPREFERLLYGIFDFLETWNFFKTLKESTYVDLVSKQRWPLYGDHTYRYDRLCLFDIVFLKNKKLLPELKKRNIKYVNSQLSYPIIYDPLMNKDIDTVDYIVSNGYEIINEYGLCFLEYRRPDNKDMVEVLIDTKNTTSIGYIYKNTSASALKKHCAWHRLSKYVYEHILPY